MHLRAVRRTWSSLSFRRFFSKDLPTVGSEAKGKELSTEKTPTEIVTPKRAFTLINPKTMHQIQRVDQMPINNEMDYVRHRLTENRQCRGGNERNCHSTRFSRREKYSDRNGRFDHRRKNSNELFSAESSRSGRDQRLGDRLFPQTAFARSESDRSRTRLERESSDRRLFSTNVRLLQYTTSSTVLSAGGLRQQFALVRRNSFGESKRIDAFRLGRKYSNVGLRRRVSQTHPRAFIDLGRRSRSRDFPTQRLFVVRKREECRSLRGKLQNANVRIRDVFLSSCLLADH